MVLVAPSKPLRRRADPRLLAYLVGGFGALVLAIASGRHELAALGAPFIVLAARGLMDRIPPDVRGAVTLARERVVESDLIEGAVHVDWNGEAEVDVMLAGLRGVTPVDPAPATGWSLGVGRGPVTMPFQVRAEAWGIHDLGALWIRIRRPGGLGAGVGDCPKPSGAAHAHPAQSPAEARRTPHGGRNAPFPSPGAWYRLRRTPSLPASDRLRDVSWGTSARLDEPWVTVHHPERTGTVLIMLDTFFTDEETGTESLARAARAAWAVASVHLRAQDRVGFLAKGKTVSLASGLIFGAVLMVGRLPGPTGLVAILVTSAACVLAAGVLVRRAD